MKVVSSQGFDHALTKAPSEIQKTFWKQLNHLSQNIRHPSLHAKKYDESNDIWQARVNQSWRFYFSITNDVIRLHDITKHPK